MTLLSGDLPIRSMNIINIKEKFQLPSKGVRILLILDHSARISVNNQSFTVTSGEIFLLLPSFKAEITPVIPMQNTKLLCTVFHMEFIRKYIPGWEYMNLNITKQLGRQALDAGQLLSQIAAIWYSRQNNRELQLMTLSYHFILILANCFPQNSGREADRTSLIGFYLENNYEHNVTLVELAEYLHISSAYLSRYIKLHFHKGFQEYLNEIRTRHALKDLTGSEHSITSIAMDNGFPNVAALNRSIKAVTNMTPNQYRKKYRTDHKISPKAVNNEEEPDFTPSAFTAIKPSSCTITSKHSEALSTVSVSPRVCGKMDNAWQDMINLGFCIHCIQTKFQNQLSALIDNIHFTYGRIQGIFKDYGTMYEQTPEKYPFSELDSIFDFFQKIHLLPHIDLTYMSHNDVFTAAQPHPELIRRFLKYYIKRYGYTAISQWRFEYDIPTDKNGRPFLTPSDYIQNYRTIQNILKEILPDASLGCFCGSPLLTWQYTENILSELCCTHIIPDYMALHLLPYEPSEKVFQETPILSTDPKFFRHYINKFQQICKKYGYEHLPIFITHLQNEMGENAWSNDSAYMAPFLFKTYTELYDKVQSIAYGAFSDIIYENNGSNPYFFGGCGIITQQGIKKPAYYALFMLGKTPQLIFHKSENCFITSSNSNTCQILMYNYVHYTTQYCISSHGTQSLDRIGSCFESGSSLRFTLDFSRWNKGTYRLQQFRLGPRHGSVLDEYIRMGIKDDMLPIEMDYLQRHSGLDITVKYITIDEQTVLTEQLEPMEICVYVLYPSI